MSKINKINKIKSIFNNRKFSIDGLFDVICALLSFALLVAFIFGFVWSVAYYPEETGICFIGVFITVIVGCVLWGIFTTIFPKKDEELEYLVDKWVDDAIKESRKKNHKKNRKASSRNKRSNKNNQAVQNQNNQFSWVVKKIIKDEIH